MSGKRRRAVGWDERQIKAVGTRMGMTHDPVTVSVGRNGTGLTPHVHGATQLRLLGGTKLWLMWPPALTPWAPRSSEWDPLAALSRDAHALVCVQPAGSTMVVPPMWGHATLNIGNTLAAGQQTFLQVGDVTKDDLQRSPASPHLRLALVLMARNPLHKARHAQTVLDADPDNVAAHYALATSSEGEERSVRCRAARSALRRVNAARGGSDPLASAGLRALAEACRTADAHGKDEV